MPPSPVIRAAGVTYVALGLGFGVGALVALSSLARDGELPMTPWGFRALSGPFERLDQQQFTALGLGLVGVCTLDVVAGVWLWQGRQRGANLGLAATLPALALGAGFALPTQRLPTGALCGQRSMPRPERSSTAPARPADDPVERHGSPATELTEVIPDAMTRTAQGVSAKRVRLQAR